MAVQEDSARRRPEEGMARSFVRSQGAVFGAVVLVIVLAASLFPSFLASQDPYDLSQISIEDNFKPPAWMEGGDRRFPLGTDNQGRDILSAIIYGSRTSFFVGVAGMVLSGLIGTFLGLLAGYFGGKLETVIMRLADVQLSFPAMLIALFIMAIWGKGVFKIIIAMAMVGWVMYARTVRASVVSEREKEYVEAVRGLGAGHGRIIALHILPNVAAPVIVIGTVRVATFIMLEATLSFLGLGVPITKPSLGLLIANGYQVLFSGLWWVSVFPGIALMLIVLAVNLLGDWLRDALNP